MGPAWLGLLISCSLIGCSAPAPRSAFPTAVSPAESERARTGLPPPLATDTVTAEQAPARTTPPQDLDAPPDSTASASDGGRVRWAALAGGGAALTGGTVAFQLRQNWWPRRRDAFRVHNDWAYVRSADKAGHAMAGYFLARAYRGPFRWAGMSDDRAAAWAAGLSWGQLLFHEVFDGYNPLQGFSFPDVAANTVGAGLAFGQSRVPALEAVSMKISYWPSGWPNKTPIDDYNGQVYWLTVNPHHLAPAPAKRALPPWLNVAVGYGARTPTGGNSLGSSLAYVGLDLELAELPFRGPVWEAVRPWLRYVHVPFPAVRVVPDVGVVPFAY